MSITPTGSPLLIATQNAASAVWGKLQGLLGHHDFTVEEGLANTKGIDPHFIPRVPMNNGNLDVSVLAELGKLGMKRGKEVTAQTHPELYQEWQAMCGRAGINRVPQLILAESKVPNAASLHNENAVVMTTGLLKRLDLREVRAVLGHELGHESSDHTTPRMLASLVLAGGGLLAGNAFAKRGGFGALIKEVENPNILRRAGQWLFGNGKDGASVLASEVYMAGGASVGLVAANQISVRPTELEADRKGAQISGDPEGLIAALTKLESERHGSAIGRFFRLVQSGYPATETRIEKLRVIAQTMPHPTPADALPTVTPAAVTPSPTPLDATPQPQIHSVTGSERVSSVPTQAAFSGL